jgi:hypothetical protein
MKAIGMIIGELIGLFVDDGSLAIAIVVVVAIIALLIKAALIPAVIGGALLFLALIAVLAENLRRSARRLHQHRSMPK